MADGRDVIYSIFGFIAGIGIFFWGFSRFRRKRLIENIPTSKVRSLAMGMVELSGKAKPSAMLISPFSETKCVFYQYDIQEYRRSGKSSKWVTIASGNSFSCPFYLDDGTGSVLIFPSGSEITLPMDYSFETGLTRAIPENIIAFMEKNNISYKSWIFTRHLRFREWFLEPEETVYVLGCAKKIEVPQKDIKNELMRRIDALKDDQKKMQELDTNKDGRISNEEWDTAVAKIEKEMLSGAVSNFSTENCADVCIGAGETDKIFIIADRSEKELLKNLESQSFLGIFGGSIMSIVLLVYVILRLGLLRF